MSRCQSTTFYLIKHFVRIIYYMSNQSFIHPFDEKYRSAIVPLVVIYNITEQKTRELVLIMLS